jgi:hypothetical protein
MKHKANQKPVEPEFLSVDDAESMTSVSRWTWRSWAYSGRIASVKAGRRLLIPLGEIRRLVAEGTHPRTEP